jgi:Flp pilus assembly protein TadG
MSTTNQMETKRRERFGSRRGQSMIEFSLVFILFITMMGGLFEFSRALWVYNTLAHATRQGARFAMVHGANNSRTAAQIEAQVRANAIGLESASLTVTPAFSPNNQPGSFVTVDATYTYSMVLGKLLFMNGRNGFAMKASSRMVVLN